MHKKLSSFILILSLPLISSTNLPATEVGVAKIDITPTHPVVLAGYGGRTQEHEGVDTKIWARALAIGKENPVLLIAVDNCGVVKEWTHEVAKALKKKSKIDDRRLVICSTHTHNAPALPYYAKVLWGGRATKEQEVNQFKYAKWLVQRMVKVGLEALDNRRPAKLEWGMGDVKFGGNRRIMINKTWRGFGLQIDAPVDRSLPLLVAKDRHGKPFALWTNYACHCTTLGAVNRIAGDWAGFSNDAIEAHFPGTIALTTIGCGADIGPQPGGNAGHAKNHGNEIGREVKRLFQAKLKPISKNLKIQFKEVQLPFEKAPDKAHFEKLSAQGGFHGEHARRMLKIFEEKGELPKNLDYPITTWSFGDDLAIVFLAGEVVVDYAVRLKKELDWSRLWINAWADDVPSYIPSKRILNEGGYEADFSQIYYDRPAKYAPDTEEIIIKTVKDMLSEEFSPKPKLGPSPYHTHPGLDIKELQKPPVLSKERTKNLRTRIKNLIAKIKKNETDIHCQGFGRALDQAQNGFKKLTKNDGSVDNWFNYTGTKRFRPFIRQTQVGNTIEWETPIIKKSKDGQIYLLFVAGSGYLTQPQTEGFKLSINDKFHLNFDATNKPAEWKNKEDNLRMFFLPTWTSNDDSGGFYFLTFPENHLPSGKPAKIKVSSLGKGSLRWFSIDYYLDAVGIFDELRN